MKIIPWMLMLWGGLLAGCSGDANPLAPYEGARPLILQRVTRSARPDLQWVGGRVAALGINRGTTPAFDTTLVWLMRTDSDTISSPVSVGPGVDAEAILELGGTPLDSLVSGETYTFWLAEASAFDALQSGAPPDTFSFADTTLTLEYLLRGRSGGDPALDVSFEIVRSQTLSGDTYTVNWTPSDVPFVRLAVRRGSSGGFTDLAWHVVVPEGGSGFIRPPVVIGQPPPGTTEVQAWTGFDASTYTLWMVTPGWDGENFALRTEGYAFYQIFSNNFE